MVLNLVSLAALHQSICCGEKRVNDDIIIIIKTGRVVPPQ
jgi:hypothetical protein